MAAWIGVWLGRQRPPAIGDLKAENRLLMDRLGGWRLQLTDADRRRLARLGKGLGRKTLAEVATATR